MELEALLLGLEPLTALAIGVGALVLAPIVGTLGSLAKDTSVGDSLSESSRSLAKTGLIWGMDVIDKTQGAVAEAGETFQDLLAEAKEARAERATAPSSNQNSDPRGVHIQ